MSLSWGDPSNAYGCDYGGDVCCEIVEYMERDEDPDAWCECVVDIVD